MLQKCVSDENVLCGLLTLLHTSGELVMLRQTYRPPAATGELSHTTYTQSDGMNEQKSESVVHVARDVSCGLVDLSSLYHGWSRRRWTRLHHLISCTGRHHHLQLCWVHVTHCTHVMSTVTVLLTHTYFTLFAKVSCGKV